MAYTPINWQTGDTITAEKLNRCDNGWGVETASTTLFDGSVTTESSMDGYSANIQLTGDLSTTIGSEATITFNGTAYTCTCFDDEGFPSYGGAYNDFSTYPFNLYYDTNTNEWSIATESAGTYTIKIVADAETIVVSDDFTSAVSGIVSSVTQAPFKITVGTTTFQEIYNAIYTNGRSAYVLTLSNINGQPQIIEPVIYVLRTSSTFLIKTIGFDGSALAIKTYTASSASGVITAS